MLKNNQVKISILSPTVRPKGLKMIEKCLSRQTFFDFEWVVISPKEHHKEIKSLLSSGYSLYSDPPKRDGDFWRLCGGWNLGFAKSKGELIVVIQDWIWFYPDMLERFWSHYLNNSKAMVSAIGHHYDKLDSSGKPENMMWRDPRVKGISFAKCGIEEMEMSVCSIPKQALVSCGGMDEDYDKGPAVGEKEMCMRMRTLGYETYMDESIEYLALHHPRLRTVWDDFYWKVTAPMFKRHAEDMNNGTRPLNIDCLTKYN